MASGLPDSVLSWWDTPTNIGNELSATGSYTTPPMNDDDTVYLHVEGTVVGGGGQGSILITEAGLEGFAGGSGSEDYLEISNLYGSTINTTGWTAAISDSYLSLIHISEPTRRTPISYAV